MSINKSKIIGENIKRVRNELNISQKVLSTRCGISVSYIRKIEHGNANLGIETFFKLADGLETDIQDLLHIS